MVWNEAVFCLEVVIYKRLQIWRHNYVISHNEYIICTFSESTIPWVYSLQFLLKSIRIIHRDSLWKKMWVAVFFWTQCTAFRYIYSQEVYSSCSNYCIITYKSHSKSSESRGSMQHILVVNCMNIFISYPFPCFDLKPKSWIFVHSTCVLRHWWGDRDPIGIYECGLIQRQLE